jgi:hypothetical protein
MNGKKAKLNRKYLRMIVESNSKTKLEIGDIRTKAHRGRIEQNEKGEDIFYAPQTLIYPDNHQRRIYQNLKKMYRNS